MHRKVLRAVRHAAVVCAGLLAFAPAAHAGYIYGLTVSNAGTGTSWAGAGSITFETLTGSTPGGVSGFSFHTSLGAGSPQDYDLADLAAVSWAIDGNFNLSLLLSTTTVPFGAGVSAILLTNQPGTHPLSCMPNPDFGSLSCSSVSGVGRFSRNGILTADLLSLTDVPEPASLALFGAGLAGLGLLRRRRGMRG